jgi:DNA repair exonuclease SbcCD nuclease subunit
MKLAITADTHLRTYQETPERYNALHDILNQISAEGIDHLVICGDLFDRDFSNYSDFEKLAAHYSNIIFLIFPGNHDINISSKSVAGANIKIFTEPEIMEEAFKLLFIPYVSGKTMGEVIATQAGNLSPRNWVLFGHGDWADGLKTPNPTEPGVYMTLTRTDIDQYLPARVFLGHIHLPSDGTVVYPGSPCGIDITETGKRRFLLFDTATNNVESRPVNTDVINQECNLTILPVEDEGAYIKQKISEAIKEWELNLTDFPKIKLRVNIKGYSRDKSMLGETLAEEFKQFSYYKNQPPDISEVNVTVDQNRIKIAETVKEKIDKLELIPSPDEPDKDQILMHALRLIFEG